MTRRFRVELSVDSVSLKVLQPHSCCFCQRAVAQRTPSLTAPGFWEKATGAACIYVQNRSSVAPNFQPVSAVVTSSPVRLTNQSAESPSLSSRRMWRQREDVTQSFKFSSFSSYLLFSDTTLDFSGNRETWSIVYWSIYRHLRHFYTWISCETISTKGQIFTDSVLNCKMAALKMYVSYK